MYIGLHVKYPFSCQILMELQFSSQVFEKYLKIKFNENPSNGSQAPPCEWMDGQRDMTKLTVVFCNFVYSPSSYSAHVLV